MNRSTTETMLAAFGAAASAAGRLADGLRRARGWDDRTGECLAPWCPDRLQPGNATHYHSAPPPWPWVGDTEQQK